MNVIETRDLSKSYKKFFSFRKFVALDRLNLDVPEGSIFGFLGLNGAGKTTTIKLLLALAYPSGGTGTLLGKPIGNVKIKERIGFLPEEAYYQRHLTATAFLDFMGKALHMDSSHRKKRISELLHLVGLGDKGSSKMSTFSKGMLQRIGVAQALLNDPDLVILDEPLTGLDPKGRAELKYIMSTLKEKGKTVFFSSHILSDVQSICDHVAILNRGRLIYQGLIEDLLSVETIEIRAQNVPATVVEKIEKIAKSISKEGTEWIFSAADDGVRGEILRILHEGNLQEESVSLCYAELEPVFLELIEKDNQNRDNS
ncbi:MAG: ABC transporter ATP-binding protein [Planctomycetes bacterium]|nr:ABC transporter ATP-binding protein [Planctomycetota bacterium]